MKINKNLSIANGIRRTLLSRLDNYAIDPELIVIHENTSSINNDQLTHRLSMIPVSNEKFNGKLTVSNVTNETIIVYTESIECDYWVYPKIPIVELHPSQTINLSFDTSIGNGEIHARYCNVTDMSFKQDYQIHFNGFILKRGTYKVYDGDWDIVKERLPHLFESETGYLIADKLFIDHNVIDNLNEILGEPDRFSIVRIPAWTLSFDTINNTIPEQELKRAIMYLLNGLENAKKLVINDISIGNIISEYHNEIETENPIAIIKKHPTDTTLSIEFLDQECSLIPAIECSMQDLQSFFN